MSERIWTIAYRKPRANRIKRLDGFAGTREEALTLCTVIEAMNRDRGLEIYRLRTYESDVAQGQNQDRKFLAYSGRRVALVETGSLHELGFEMPQQV